MSALANRDFVKMNGLGNEIVVVDLRQSLQGQSLLGRGLQNQGLQNQDLQNRDLQNQDLQKGVQHDAQPIAAAEARAAAAHEPYDQLMALYPGRNGSDAVVRIYNNDGSEAGACGNGMRCVASLVSAQTGKAQLTFETSAGAIACWRAADGLFTVDMGAPRFRWDEIPLSAPMPDTRAIDLEFGPPGTPLLRAPSAVNMGNPHAIFWVDDPAAYDLSRIGPELEHHALFPERANITLAATPARDRVVIRTWERGAGLTKACGSAACAAAVAAARLSRTGRKVMVTLPGGDLAIDWRESDDHVLMTGPVAYEHRGRFDAALFAAGAA